MRAVLRFLFVIPLGFVAGCVAAAFALLWPFLDLSGPALADPGVVLELGVGFVLQTAQIGSAVLLPWALFMVASELLALSSVLLHLAAGFCGALLAALALYGTEPPALSVQTAILVAGLAFALVYWTVAGRAAGSWRRRSPTP